MESKEQTVTTVKRVRGKAIAIGAVLAMALGATGVLGYQYYNARERLQKLENPTEAARAEAEALVQKISVLIALPGDETPTVATVTDAAKLKAQAFFAHTENGDKVLIYTKSKKAILYRPNDNKIIEVAPVNIGQQN